MVKSGVSRVKAAFLGEFPAAAKYTEIAKRLFGSSGTPSRQQSSQGFGTNIP
jgi:hypothetical protein